MVLFEKILKSKFDLNIHQNAPNVNIYKKKVSPGRFRFRFRYFIQHKHVHLYYTTE